MMLMFGQVCSLDETDLAETVSSGQVFVFDVVDEHKRLNRVRTAHNAGDAEGTVRVYMFDDVQAETAPTEGEWVQIPSSEIDFMTEGDLATGSIVFRAHLEVTPV